MNIKSKVKHVISFLLHGEPKQVTANVVSLNPSELLKNRCALITGGTSGIGYAIAESFLKAGMSAVVITGRNQLKIDETCSKLSKYRGACLGFVMDNTKIDTFASTFDKMQNALKEKGLGQIDVLVNNAGVLGAVLPNADEATYDAVLDTNLKGVFFLSQLIGKYFKENNIKGNILNIASSSSLRPAQSAYTISKWGIRGLTLGLAKCLAPYGITVNGVAPGPTATPMLKRDGDKNLVHEGIPLGRFVMPEEIANMAVFLVSDMGHSILGDIVYMTGGAGVLGFDDMAYNF